MPITTNLNALFSNFLLQINATKNFTKKNKRKRKSSFSDNIAKGVSYLHNQIPTTTKFAFQKFFKSKFLFCRCSNFVCFCFLFCSCLS